MAKTIKVTSKSGKVYYRQKSRKSAVLVDKQGRIHHKAVNALKAKIDADDTLTAMEKRYLKADLDNYTKQAEGDKRSHSMTENSFLAHNKEDKTSRMLANLGYDPSSLADELGVSEEDVLNGTFSDNTFEVAGKTFSFEFRYTGNAFTLME